MTAEYLCGNCVVCRRYLGDEDYNRQNVIALIDPTGTVVCCADHFNDGPHGPNYKDAVERMALAKATQLQTTRS
jgi:hypothetical protein